MLVDIKLNYFANPIAAVIAQVGNRPAGAVRVTEGVYSIGHWNFDMETSTKLESYIDMDYNDPNYFDDFGVCDNYQQVLDKWPQLVNSDTKYVMSIVSMKKSDQPDDGGWRWHKWGEYIGTQNPQHEYLYDEEHINEVFTYSIHKIIE